MSFRLTFPPAAKANLRLIGICVCTTGMLGIASSGSPASPDPLVLGTLSVRVVRLNGSPLTEARVCLLLNNNGSSKSTDNQGRVTFSGVPAERHRLIVYKSGFEHIDQSFTMSATDFSLPVELREGSSTPPTIGACFATSLTPVPLQPINPVNLPIRVTNFHIDVGTSQTAGGVPTTTNQAVTLTATFSRQPAFYRAGETANLSSRPWLPFTSPLRYALYVADERGVTYGPRKVYLQVADTSLGDNSSLSVNASVVFAPQQVSPRTLTGAELQQFLSRALDAGYNFTAGGINRQLFEGSVSRPFTDGTCSPQEPEIELRPDFFGAFRYIQDNTIRIFEGPPLNAFWKITNVVITPRNDQGASSVVRSVSAASTTGLNQVPFRTVEIRSESQVKRATMLTKPGDIVPYFVCISSASNFRITLRGPTITSLTIEGPSNFNVKDALPPRN